MVVLNQSQVQLKLSRSFGKENPFLVKTDSGITKLAGYVIFVGKRDSGGKVVVFRQPQDQKGDMSLMTLTPNQLTTRNVVAVSNGELALFNPPIKIPGYLTTPGYTTATIDWLKDKCHCDPSSVQGAQNPEKPRAGNRNQPKTQDPPKRPKFRCTFPGCEKSDYAFSSKQSLSTHQNIHAKDNKVACETCGKQYTKHGISRHICRLSTPNGQPAGKRPKVEGPADSTNPSTADSLSLKTLLDDIVQKQIAKIAVQQQNSPAAQQRNSPEQQAQAENVKIMREQLATAREDATNSKKEAHQMKTEVLKISEQRAEE